MDYTSAAEVLAAIETLDADVAARLRAIAAVQPAAAAFAASASAGRRRRLEERARLAARLRVPAAPPPAAAPASASLRGLRDAQQALVYAHAEGLPALGDRRAVDLLARHMASLAGQLTVIDLWIEDEEKGARE